MIVSAFVPAFDATGIIGGEGDKPTAVEIGNLGVAGVGPSPAWNADAKALEGGKELLLELLAILGGDDDAAGGMGGEPPGGETGDDAGSFAGAIRCGEGAEHAGAREGIPVEDVALPRVELEAEHGLGVGGGSGSP